MSLVNILKEMEENRPQAEAIIQLEPSTTYGSRVGVKRAAGEALKRLKDRYRKELMGSAMFIVVTGPGREAFTEVASGDNFGCFTVDPDDFYKDLVSRITPNLIGRESVRFLFNIAGNLLRDKAKELDIKSFNMLMFSEKYNRAADNTEDFTALLKSAINDQVGSEIVGLNAVNSILDKAIDKKHSAPVTPVVLSTSDEKFALDLQNNLKRLKTKVFLVVAGKTPKNFQGNKEALLVKTVSEETVAGVLGEIRDRTRP